MKNLGAPKKMPSGLKVGKPVSQRSLRSALNLEKTHPIPEQRLDVAKSGGSALKYKPNLSNPKSKWSGANNFKE